MARKPRTSKSSSFKIARSTGRKAKTEGKGLACHTHGSGLAFFRKGALSHGEGEKSDFPVPLGPGVKQSSALMLTPGQTPRPSLRAWPLGLLSSDLGSKKLTHWLGVPQQQALFRARAETERSRDPALGHAPRLGPQLQGTLAGRPCTSYLTFLNLGLSTTKSGEIALSTQRGYL